jgi:hypothetical protein
VASAFSTTVALAKVVRRKIAAVAAALLLASAPPDAAIRVDVLRSVGGLPAHIAGSFQSPVGFQQSDAGVYYVFDRRGHSVHTVAGGAPIKIMEVGAEEGRVLDPTAFDIDPSDGSFVIADAPFGRQRIQTFTGSGARIGGFTLPGRQMARLTLNTMVLNGVGSMQFTGRTILISQPESGALVTELAFDGTPARSFGRLRATGQEADANVHLAMNAGLPLIDPTGGFYFVFLAGVPVFRKYDAKGTLVFERHVEGREMDEYIHTLPTRWPTRRTEDGDLLPLVLPAVRTAAVDRAGRLWIALGPAPVTYVYDASGDKVKAVQFRGADTLQPNSLFFTKDGRVLVTPGCYEFRVPAF